VNNLMAALLLMSSTLHAEPIGFLNPNVSATNIRSTVCIPNYTKTIRPPASYTNKLKKRQIVELKLSGVMSDYEEDHYIPLSLGGNPTDPRNLWPQSWTGKDNARNKDVIETALHRMLCNDEISLEKAQECVLDWKTCKAKIDYIKRRENK
jgi:hypothetical protein